MLRHHKAAFTIIELLIVIVIIGILVVITSVVYVNITTKAARALMESDIKNVSTAIEVYKTLNDDNYPASIKEITDSNQFKPSNEINFQYSYSQANDTYCLTAYYNKSNVPPYKISSEDKKIMEGACSGHTQTPIISEGLAFHIDASNTASYPGSGVTWYDISGGKTQRYAEWWRSV